MNKAHIIKLKPTKSQEIFFKKSCGERSSLDIERHQDGLSMKQELNDDLLTIKI